MFCYSRCWFFAKSTCLLVFLLAASLQLPTFAADVDYESLGDRIRNNGKLSEIERDYVKRATRKTGLTPDELADKLDRDWEKSERMERENAIRRIKRGRNEVREVGVPKKDMRVIIMVTVIGLCILFLILGGRWAANEIRMRRLEADRHSDDSGRFDGVR